MENIIIKKRFFKIIENKKRYIYHTLVEDNKTLITFDKDAKNIVFIYEENLYKNGKCEEIEYFLSNCRDMGSYYCYDIDSFVVAKTTDIKEIKTLDNLFEYNKYQRWIAKNNIKETHNLKINGEWLFNSGIRNINDLFYLSNKIAKLYKKYQYDCMDNNRFAIKNNKKQVEDYNEQLNSGCCGFYDVEFKNPKTGNTFLYGFNYGH